MEAEICEVQRLGEVEYDIAWKLQDHLAAEIAAGNCPPTLLLLEHPHTYTFGRRGQAQNLLWDEAECARRGIRVHWVDRGGDVTYHGPGQLVGYPLLPLAPGGVWAGKHTEEARIPQADYVGYLRKLERALILALGTLGVAGEQIEGLTGVWVRQPGLAKVAAIGVKVDAHGISRHGFALNVDPDMSYWNGIIGCGLAGSQTISLAQILQPVPAMETVMDCVTEAFGQIFDLQMSSRIR